MKRDMWQGVRGWRILHACSRRMIDGKDGCRRIVDFQSAFPTLFLAMTERIILGAADCRLEKTQIEMIFMDLAEEKCQGAAK